MRYSGRNFQRSPTTTSNKKWKNLNWIFFLNDIQETINLLCEHSPAQSSADGGKSEIGRRSDFQLDLKIVSLSLLSNHFLSFALFLYVFCIHLTQSSATMFNQNSRIRRIEGEKGEKWEMMIVKLGMKSNYVCSLCASHVTWNFFHFVGEIIS